MKIPKKEMVCTLNGTGKIVVNQVEYQFDADCEMAMNCNPARKKENHKFIGGEF